MFIKLTYDGVFDTRKGLPYYVDSRGIALIEDKLTNTDGSKSGSYVYLKYGLSDPIAVKESPEEIIAMINDGDFCMYSKELGVGNKFIFSRGEQTVE